MESSNLYHPPLEPTLHQTPSTSSNGGGASFKRAPAPLFIPHGHVAFRLLCHSSLVGGLIGKSGSIIKKLQEQTGSKIRVDEDPAHSPDHRVISVIAPPHIVKRLNLETEGEKGEGEGEGFSVVVNGEEEGFEEGVEVSAAQEGVVRVFERVVEVAAEGNEGVGEGGVVSCRLVVGRSQGGAVIGRGGQVVERMRRESGCRIKVLGLERMAAFGGDAIVEIEGDILGVKKALVAVTSRLQEFPPVEQTKVYRSKPFEAESLPVAAVDLPLHRSPQLQPMPSYSINGASRGSSSSLDSDKISNSESRPRQLEVILMTLCPIERVGSIIGKGGEIIRALQSETGASITIGPTMADCSERLITITAVENVESQYSPAQNAAVLVFNKYMQSGDVQGLDFFSKGSTLSGRVVVPLNQVGCLLGKGGSIISEMRKVTGTGLRIVGGDQVPICAPENVEVLQITGEFSNVLDAFFKVTRRLRDNIISSKMSNGNGYNSSLRTENGINGRVKNTPMVGVYPSVGIQHNLNEQTSLIHSMGSLGISNNTDQSQSLSSLAPSSMVSAVNQGNVVDGGRTLPSAKGGVEFGRSAIVTNTTIEIAVPDNIIGSIYGESGSNLARLREISGAKVTVHEPHPGTTDRIVIISGTPDQTQAAQSLLHAFISAGS